MDLSELVLLYEDGLPATPALNVQCIIRARGLGQNTHCYNNGNIYFFYPEFWSFFKLSCIASNKLSSCELGDFSSINIWRSILPERIKKMYKNGFSFFYHLELQNTYFMLGLQEIGYAVLFAHLSCCFCCKVSQQWKIFCFFPQESPNASCL